MTVMRKSFLFLFYVVVSLLIGKEFHPFSLFPMYNSFPNYSYAFLLKNEKGELIPYRKNFSKDKNAGGLAHQYYAFFNYHHYQGGFGGEDSVYIKEAGKELMAKLLQDENTNRFNFDTLRLYKRYYHLDHDSIRYRDDLMYEQAINH